MLQLTPGEQYPIVRVLKDHTDTSTNYVRAVVKNAATNATIESINLTDQGNRIFSKVWDVPVDSTGKLFIVIITTVYTDSGYATKNQNYFEEATEYLLEQRWTHSFGGGGGGVGVDYKKIREIVREIVGGVFSARIRELPAPEINVIENVVDFRPYVSEILRRVGDMVDEVRPEPVDLSQLSKQITLLFREIRGIERPKDVNLSPVIRRIEAVAEGIALARGDTADAASEILNNLAQLLGHESRRRSETQAEAERRIGLERRDAERGNRTRRVSRVLGIGEPDESKKKRIAGLLSV